MKQCLFIILSYLWVTIAYSQDLYSPTGNMAESGITDTSVITADPPITPGQTGDDTTGILIEEEFQGSESDISVADISLIEDFYANRASLNRSYEYELLNKQRKYLSWSKDIKILGYGVTLACLGVASAFAVTNHWSLSWYLPTATAIGCGIIIGSLKWSQYYQRKAGAIEFLQIATVEINKSLSMAAYTLSGREMVRQPGIGIGLTANF